MLSRDEYLEMLRSELRRLQGDTSTVTNQNEAIGSGITVTTTIGNKTTVARSTQTSVGNVSVSVGCLDFSRKGDPCIPDGTVVDGVRLEEKANHNPTLFGHPKQLGGVELVNQVTETDDCNNVPHKAPGL